MINLFCLLVVFNVFATPFEDAVLALRLPLEKRIEVLKTIRQPFATLKTVSEDSSQPLQVRWRSLTALSRIDPERSIPILQANLSSKEWFLRNAALIALKNCSRPRAIEAASSLLSDPALVVRTSAVQVLSDLNAAESSGVLWKKLFAEENFRNGQSLWIRKHIAQTLLQFSNRGSRNQFQDLLKDKDSTLHPMALHGLQKVTGKNLSREEWLQTRSL